MGHVGHQAPVDEDATPTLAEAVHVHRTATDEMLQRLEELGRASGVGAAVHGIAEFLYHSSFALRAVFGHPKRGASYLAGYWHVADHMGG